MGFKPLPPFNGRPRLRRRLGVIIGTLNITLGCWFRCSVRPGKVTAHFSDGNSLTTSTPLLDGARYWQALGAPSTAAIVTTRFRPRSLGTALHYPLRRQPHRHGRSLQKGRMKADASSAHALAQHSRRQIAPDRFFKPPPIRAPQLLCPGPIHGFGAPLKACRDSVSRRLPPPSGPLGGMHRTQFPILQKEKSE